MIGPDAFDIDTRWTGWSRRVWNADVWIGPVPLGKTLAAAALVWGVAQWL